MWAVSWTNEDGSKASDTNLYSEDLALILKGELESAGKTGVTVCPIAELAREQNDA